MASRATNATVDAYIKAQPKELRPMLTRIRRTIKAAVPGAEEKISYRIPAYYFHGHLAFFAVHKNHCSFYPTSMEVITAHRNALKPFTVRGTTIHFSLEHPLHTSLITKLVTMRARENEEPARKKVRRTAVTSTAAKKGGSRRLPKSGVSRSTNCKTR